MVIMPIGAEKLRVFPKNVIRFVAAEIVLLIK